ATIRAAIRGMSARDLDRRGGEFSPRETVHHLVEANLVAANMIIAALATNGGNYDWTWVWPSREWMKRVGYDRVDAGAAIAALRGVIGYVAELVASQPDGLSRTVKLNDAPRAPRYSVTVEEILRREVDHVTEHLASIR
ncbi:MAG TPA: DinB family protein, partial [Thermoanaerobaculia bacterium]|nr:DinB family protein [Thermoanaerobaculia bacterium]